MRKNSKKTKLININIVLFLIMILTLIVVSFSEARYKNMVQADTIIDLANWTFKIEGEETNNININLGDYKKSSRLVTAAGNTIAPGNSGVIVLNLDFTDCQTSINYEIALTENQNNPLPSMLEISVQNDDGTTTDLKTTNYLKTKSLEEIKENPIETIVIRWIWTINEDIIESDYEGKEFDFNLQIIGSQKY